MDVLVGGVSGDNEVASVYGDNNMADVLVGGIFGTLFNVRGGGCMSGMPVKAENGGWV